jgi:homoaconitase/3-isopropylmalate dehydratase large subunit
MRRLALLAAFLIAACGSFGAEAHTLSLAYKPGDTYKYSLHAVLKYAVGAQGLSIPIELDLSGIGPLVALPSNPDNVVPVSAPT